MRLDAALGIGLGGTVAAARSAEEAGYDGVWTVETRHDAFLPLVLAAEHTQRLQLGTAIAVALARNPMTVATKGHDLGLWSRGRFVLGLGSQVRPHIQRRFSMPWSRPADRMREFVLAIRAIWSCWNDGTTLDFRGDFYSHTLMTPFSHPGPNPFGAPPIFLAGVGEQMTEVAGEVADGFFCHAFSTPAHFRNVTVPSLQRGLVRAGRTLDDIEISVPSFVVTGSDEDELARAERAVRQQIAFYGSTPAYRGVLDLHGWGALHEELHAASRRGEWERMADLVDDEVLAAFAVVGAPYSVGRELHRRYGEHAGRLTLDVPYASDPAAAAGLLEAVRDGLDDARVQLVS